MLRSQRNSRTLWSALLALFLACAGFANAQERTPVLTIDLDRLLAETTLGVATLDRLEARAQEIATENETIEESLTAEELELTEKRATLSPEDFRVLADEFDTRVQKFREEQDEKVRQLNRAREDARNQFLRDAAPIISEIVRNRGATVVIERRDVFLSAEAIDITEEAIARLNDTGETE